MNAKSSEVTGETGNADDPQYHDYLQRVKARFEKNVSSGSVPLFTTDAAHLFSAYLDGFGPPGWGIQNRRQHFQCSACARFISAFGGLVTIDEHGKTHSAIWNTEDATPEQLGPIINMLRIIDGARVTGVFLSSESVYGFPVTGVWHHLALTAPAESIFVPVLKTAAQAMAAKREDFQTVLRAMAEWQPAVVEKAVTLLRSDALYRSEKVFAQAEWFYDLQTYGHVNKRINRIWRAIATAPDGFCHPRTSMLGTLLDDIASGKDFDTIARAFAEKMNPTKYQRPQAAPAAGNIAAAEKIVDTLGIARSLLRRFAKVSEIQAIWSPQPPKLRPGEKTIEDVGADRLRALLRSAGIDPMLLSDAEVIERYRQRFGDRCVDTGGVFGHLKTKADPPAPNQTLRAPARVMTFAKFQRDVLPMAQRIDCFVPNVGNFAAIVTAVDPDAPPILQWDHADARNPFSHYLYPEGSTAFNWSLPAGCWVAVTAIALCPHMWDGKHNEHRVKSFFVLLSGAKDKHRRGACLFPENLKSELREIRATIEAYSKTAEMIDAPGPLAQGLRLGAENLDAMQSHSHASIKLRVHTFESLAMDYTIDRLE